MQLAAGISSIYSISELLDCFAQFQDAGIQPVITEFRSFIHVLVRLSMMNEDEQLEYIAQFNQGAKRSWHNEDHKQEVAKLLAFIDQDNYSHSWQSASKQFVDNDIPFFIAGDWSKEYINTTLEYQFGKDFDSMVFPGTERVFLAVVDAFGISAHVQNKDTAKSWISMLASEAGQTHFNLAKGSIPARMDITREQFDAYSQRNMEDYWESIKRGTLMFSGR